MKESKWSQINGGGFSVLVVNVLPLGGMALAHSAGERGRLTNWLLSIPN